MGIILVRKVIEKLMLSKNVNNKKCAPKFIFFNEKKFRKIQMIFDIENWLWMWNFGTFWQLAINQNSIISFGYYILILSNIVPPFENSTTHIALPYWLLMIAGVHNINSRRNFYGNGRFPLYLIGIKQTEGKKNQSK